MKFTAYGLVIASEFPLPELLTGGGSPDVSIRAGRVKAPEVRATHQDYFVRMEMNRAWLVWKGELRILVENGRRMTVDKSRDVSERALRLCLLGPALYVLLQQRGVLMIHAGAVASKGGAYAFVGASGAGKSTMVSVLQVRGHRLVTDNGLAVRFIKEKPYVLPAFPQVKLLPKTLKFLRQDARRYEGTEPFSKKKSVLYSGNAVSRKPLPLKRIYLLKKGRRLSVDPLSRGEALRHLISHSLGAPEVMDRELLTRHFRQCAGLCRTVPVSKVTRTGRIRSLPALAARLVGGRTE